MVSEGEGRTAVEERSDGIGGREMGRKEREQGIRSKRTRRRKMKTGK